MQVPVSRYKYYNPANGIFRFSSMIFSAGFSIFAESFWTEKRKFVGNFVHMRKNLVQKKSHLAKTQKSARFSWSRQKGLRTRPEDFRGAATRSAVYTPHFREPRMMRDGQNWSKIVILISVCCVYFATGRTSKTGPPRNERCAGRMGNRRKLGKPWNLRKP